MLKDIVQKLNIDTVEERPFQSVVEFLPSLWMPDEIIVELMSVSRKDGFEIGPIKFLPFNRLQSLNMTELYLPWLRLGFLTFAAGLSGDPVAFDLGRIRIAYLCHDRMDETQPPNAGDVVIANLSFSDFYQSAHTDNQFPRDWYAAEKRWGEKP